MSFIGFIKDENGNYYSENRKTRYTMFEGEELIKFLKDTKGEPRYFHMEIDEEGNRYVFETDRERALKMKREMDHIWYKEQCKKSFGYQIVSANSICDICETETELIENISYEDDMSIEDLIVSSINLKKLRCILKKLKHDEYELIYLLYLCKDPLTIREYANIKSIPVMTAHCRKQAVLKKIKKFL